MGGFAAKQRRRLERQSLQSPVDQKGTKTASSKDHPTRKKVVSETSPSSKKFQKPKHLKRKLEAIENGGCCFSEEEQEHLRHQVKEYEIIKGCRIMSTIYKEDSGLRKSSTSDVGVQPHALSECSDEKVSQGSSRIDVDSDDEDDLNLDVSRQRGKRLRRRGRNCTACQSSDDATATVAVGASDSSMNADIVPGSSRSDDVDRHDEATSKDASSDNLAKDHNSSKVRRCIGRKPVTDFTVGQYYSGKVVYAKSFGVFFDIGCHSDAFCHVSQLSDQFIASPVEAFPVGKSFDRIIRVVAIDRRKKRLTVSLQHATYDKDSKRLCKVVAPPAAKALEETPNPSVEYIRGSSPVTASVEIKTSSSCRSRAEQENAPSTQEHINELDVTALSKRDRKIARRAQRRSEKEQ